MKKNYYTLSRKAILLLLFILYSTFSYSAIPYMAGKPSIINFTRNDYSAGTQNWNIIQQKDGLLYIANNYGLLEYGPGSWKMTPFKYNKIIRSLYSDNKGRIFAGGAGEFGYYTKERSGKLKYTSISKSTNNWDEIWRIHNTGQEILFESKNKIFSYNEKDCTVYFEHPNIEFSAYLNNMLYVQIKGVGLGVVNNGVFRLVSQGETFAEMVVRGIFSASHNSVIVCTLDNGIFICADAKTSPLKGDTNKELCDNQIYSTFEYMNEYIAIGSVTNGLYLITKSGECVLNINKNNGLQNNTILSLSADKYNNLWLGLDNGISMVELYAPVSFIDSHTGLGTGYVSKLHNNTLYLGTNQGLFYVPWKPGESFDQNKIKFVQGTGGQVWSLNVINGKVYCGHHRGTFLVEGSNAQLISNNAGGWKMENLSDGYYVQNTYYSLVIYKLQPSGALTMHGELPLEYKIRREFNANNGYCWLWLEKGGIVKIKVDPGNLKITQEKQYEKGTDLPESAFLRIVKSRGDVCIATQDGIYAYLPSKDTFVKDTTLSSLIHRGVENMFVDDYSRIWFSGGANAGYIVNSTAYRGPFMSILDKITWHYNDINVVNTESAIFGITEGFAMVNTSSGVKKDISHRVFIRGVECTSNHSQSVDSLISSPSPVISYRNNGLIFRFSSNYFESGHGLTYRVKLKGDSDQWSEWTPSQVKEYTNIREGRYAFMVQAKNRYGELSDVAEYEFTVKPPLLRSIGAIIVYILAAMAGIWALYRLILRRTKMRIKKIHEWHRLKRIENEIEIVRLRNHSLESELKYQSQELTNSTYNMIQKNEMLNKIKGELQVMVKEKDLTQQEKKIKKAMRFIDDNLNSQKDWKLFEANFNKVHENFFKNLKAEYPTLTQNDLRLCAYLSMNKTSKEIASLMNISIRGVESGRYRLRKKMNIEREDKIFDIILDRE